MEALRAILALINVEDNETKAKIAGTLATVATLLAGVVQFIELIGGALK